MGAYSLFQRCMNLIKGSAALHAIGDHPSIHAETISPSADGVCDSICRKKSCGAQIICLLLCCSPAAVARLVIPICVNPINRVKWARSNTHILQEVFVLPPPFANGNSSSAVEVVLGVAMIIAPFSHADPSSIFLGLFSVSGSEAVSFWFANNLFVQAAARLGAPAFELCALHRRLIPAIAHDIPFKNCSPVCVFGFLPSADNGQPAKLLTC